MAKYERIYRELREQIRIGQLAAGDRLPTDRELCAVYTVSRINSGVPSVTTLN